MTARSRHQLVICLGEGSEGRKVKEILSKVAKRDGLQLSVWARQVLLEAAGAGERLDFVRRPEFEALAKRVRGLEDRAAFREGVS